MQPTQNQRQSTLESARNSLGVALFVCRAWATSLEVFLHRDIGERYLNWQAAAVLLLVPLYGLGWKGYDLRPLMLFLPAYLFMCIVARLGMLMRRLRGVQGHSFYTGWPRFLGPKAKISERRMKQFEEPIVTFLLGWAVRDQFDAPLGTYLMIGGVCLFVSVSACASVERAQAMDLNDAVIDQQMTAEQFRAFRGDQD